MYDTSFLNMQPLGEGIFFFVLTRVFARFQQSCTQEASLQIFWNSIGSLSQTLYLAQLTESINIPFFLLNFFNICLLSLRRISFLKYISCLYYAVLSVPCSLVSTCWERTDILTLLCVVYSCVFLTFPNCVLGQVWYLILDLYAFLYFVVCT